MRSIWRGPDSRATMGTSCATRGLIADRLARETQEGDMVGLYLPGSVHLPAAFLATQSAGVAAVLIDDAHAADLVASATRLSAIRRVLTSRHLADRDAAKVIEDLEAGGARIQYAEDVVEGAKRMAADVGAA